mmetsp:Transcript_22047/g.53370  ORF Transcript_22047/g.53370 Transcript_22047/m.53370 type:complete len:139 (+) Transcript_22047:74-490(+)
MKTNEASASSYISMLNFLGTALLARRYVQSASRTSNPKARLIHSHSDPPRSLVESLSLCPEQVESLRSQHMSASCSISYKNTGPLHIVSGHNSRLVDRNGAEYLDTRNNVAHCGHGHPEILRAITHQVNQLNVRDVSW